VAASFARPADHEGLKEAPFQTMRESKAAIAVGLPVVVILSTNDEAA